MFASLLVSSALLAIASLSSPVAAVPSPATTTASPSAVTATHATKTIHIENFTFVPATLTIRAGETVAFANDDDEAHTVTATDRSFDSAGLDSAQTWTHVFAAPGKFTYFCELHPYMKATIVVLPGRGAAR